MEERDVIQDCESRVLYIKTSPYPQTYWVWIHVLDYQNERENVREGEGEWGGKEEEILTVEFSPRITTHAYHENISFLL